MIPKNTKLLVVISIFFFIGALVVCGIFIQRVYAQKAVYTEKNVERLEMIERDKSFDALKKALEDTASEREVLKNAILESDGLIQFLALIERLGREQGVTLTTSSLSEASIDSTFQSLVIHAKVVGQHSAVIHVLTLLEQLPYQISLHGLRFERQDSIAPGQWMAGFEIRVTQFKKI